MQLNETPNEHDTWRKIEPLLDDAMENLGQKERDAIVLRFFDGKSMKEVGDALELSEDTAKKRVSRGLEKLRKSFARHGFASSTTIIAAALSSHSVQSAPATLAQAVSSVAAVKGAAAGISTLNLVKGSIKLMAWTKIKTAAVVAAVVLLGGSTSALLIQSIMAQAERHARAEAEKMPPGRYVKEEVYISKARVVDLRLHDWAKERKEEEKRIKSGQKVNKAPQAITIDLSSHINAALSESIVSRIGVKDNAMDGLPQGVHLYAGIPFDVCGVIQLDSTTTAEAKYYPAKVNNIQIRRNFSKIHLLHAGNFCYSRNFGKPAAQLILHYADGSTNAIDLIAGEHVLDYWMVMFKTGVNPKFLNRAPGTERAWYGTNPRVQQMWPDESLALYKSTFDNPKPGSAVASIDYVSTMTEVAPFLAGLTLD